MVNPNADESSHRRVSKEHHPSFFQLFVEHKNSINLRIPPPFIKNFHGKIPRKISLKDMFGLVWCAKMSYIGDYLHITSGWKEFVEEHSLNTKDFLVFHYVPDSTFLVRIFDSDGCNKGAPLVKKNRNTTNVRNLRFERIMNTSFSSFVTISKSVIEQCDVKRLPRKVKLSFEEGVSTITWLRKIQDRIILGYAGMGRFWEMNNVQNGDKLQFQIICGEGMTIKKIIVRRIP
ncbi:B3 domain-containing protein At5g18000-like [Silene latifolia]|uniref:B3 domain-containing protein At5g18000-like n=1 Tax=Silene latifolia TaxID=37657 RepID=UPI003D77DC15